MKNASKITLALLLVFALSAFSACSSNTTKAAETNSAESADTSASAPAESAAATEKAAETTENAQVPGGEAPADASAAMPSGSAGMEGAAPGQASGETGAPASDSVEAAAEASESLAPFTTMEVAGFAYDITGGSYAAVKNGKLTVAGLDGKELASSDISETGAFDVSGLPADTDMSFSVSDSTGEAVAAGTFRVTMAEALAYDSSDSVWTLSVPSTTYKIHITLTYEEGDDLQCTSIND